MDKMRRALCGLSVGLALAGLASEATAGERATLWFRAAHSRAVRVWSRTDLGAPHVAPPFVARDLGPLAPRVIYPLALEPPAPPPAPLAPARSTFNFSMIGVREQMDRSSPPDHYSAADMYSAAGPAGEKVYVVQIGQDDNVVAYGKRYGDMGGEGRLQLGKLVEASGSALFRRDGQLSIVHNIDLKVNQLALNALGLSVSPFVRAGFLIDFYPDGTRRGSIIPGGGVDLSVPVGCPYPLRFNVMVSPEISIGPGRTSRLGERLMLSTGILMF